MNGKHGTFPIILRKEREGGYFVENLALEGCYSQGETVEEALKNIREEHYCVWRMRGSQKWSLKTSVSTWSRYKSMPKFPRLSVAEMIRILEHKGYIQVRTKGSHVRLYPPEYSAAKKITVPLHGELKVGTLLSIMKAAGLTIDDLHG